VLDVVEPLVARAYPEFTKFVHKVQLDIITAAVKANQRNLVTTFAYTATGPDDTNEVREFIRIARELGGDAYPIFLHSKSNTLHSRVIEPSRKQYGKITSLETINKMIEQYDFDTPVAVEGNTVIEVDDLSAEEVAFKIKRLINL
jgi:hypothetical protein